MHLDEEPFVNCSDCGRKNHKICVLFHESVMGRFVCQTCRKDNRDRERKLEFYSSKRLLSAYLCHARMFMMFQQGFRMCG